MKSLRGVCKPGLANMRPSRKVFAALGHNLKKKHNIVGLQKIIWQLY
jgi:hypothetical protein